MVESYLVQTTILRLQFHPLRRRSNSGYGAFGNAYFKYQDPRVAELITGYGQYTIKELEKYVGNRMIYGDTDSLYLSNRDDTIIAKAAELGVTLEFERLWKGLFLSSLKKWYFGLTQEGKVIHKTLKGMKSDQPDYFREVTEKLVSKEFMKLFINVNPNGNTNNTNPLTDVVDYIKSAFIQLPNANLNELAFSQEAAKALYEYKNNGKERQMYSEILEDYGGDIELANSKSQEKHIYKYWKIIGRKGRSVTTHPELYQLNMDKYREELFNSIEPILEAYGMREEELDELYVRLIGRKRPKKNEDRMDKQQMSIVDYGDDSAVVPFDYF